MRAASNHVMALFPGALGDLVLATPTLRRLRTVHPSARMTLAVDRRWMSFATASAVADDVQAIDGVDMAGLLGGGAPPAWWGWPSQLYAWLGAHDVQMRERLSAHAGAATFASVVRGEGSRHAAAEYARTLGWRAAWSELVAAGRMPEASHMPKNGPAGSDRMLAVHRGAGAPTKRWPTRAFEHVAAWWRERRGVVVDVRGPDDETLPPLRGADAVARPSVAELGALLARAAAFLGNDSGPAHVAGVVGVRGVVVYGPTDPARWRPLSHGLVPMRVTYPHRPGASHPEADAVIDVLARCVA